MIQDQSVCSSSAPLSQTTPPPQLPTVDVSVLVITFNHAPFIEMALNSVLDQNTDRSVEIIISEDCSTDGTRKMVQDYAARHANIRLILSQHNVRSNETVARAIRADRQSTRLNSSHYCASRMPPFA